MSPKQINHAIHKHFGWEYVPAADGWRRNDRELHYEIPNYHGDLNAMHEAENTLTDEQFGRYCFSLQHLYLELSQYRSALGAISATAAQRAEAFLRTVGKWNDQ